MSTDRYSDLVVEAVVDRLQKRWGHLTKGDFSIHNGSATDYSHGAYMDAVIPDLKKYAARLLKERELLDE